MHTAKNDSLKTLEPEDWLPKGIAKTKGRVEAP